MTGQTPMDPADSFLSRHQDSALAPFADQVKRWKEEAAAAAATPDAAAKTGSPASATPPPATPAPPPAGASPPAPVNLAPDADFDHVGGSVRDLGVGFTEVPRAVLHGLTTAGREILETVGSVYAWQAESGLLDVLPHGADAAKTISTVATMAAADDRVVPKVKRPKSTTGNLVSGLTQFLAPFAAFGKAMKAGTATSKGARFALDMVRGGMVDAAAFDAMEPNLFNLINEHAPALKGPVTEFLATDPEDGEAVNKLRRVAEGSLGALIEPFLWSVRAMRGWRAARKAEKGLPTGSLDEALAGPVAPPGATVVDRDFMILGDPEAPLIQRRAVDKPETVVRQTLRDGDQAAAYGEPRVQGDRLAEPRPADPANVAAPTSADTSPRGIFINWARVDAPDDIVQVMQDMADGDAKAILEARRGKTVTHGQTVADAADVDAWGALMDRRAKGGGATLSAAETVKARALWAQSADKLTEVAELAARDPSEANIFAFRKMMAVHYTVQREVLAARAEAARALDSWRIPVGGGMERAQAIQQVLDQTGGAAFHRELAQRIALFKDADMARQLDAVVEGSIGARTRDALLTAWINGLLSGPKTHMVNMMGNTVVMLQQTVERAAAARISKMFGTDAGVEAGEALAQYHGLVEGLKDAFRLGAKGERFTGETAGTAWRSIATGKSGFGVGKIELPRENAIGHQWVNASPDSFPGAALDFLGDVVTLPGRALNAEDEVFKTIGYRMELHAQAARRAAHEAAAGKIAPDAVKARAAELVAAPPEWLRMEAVDQAAYQTFTKALGPTGRGFSNFVNRHAALKVIFPFVRTPANIFKYGLERTPLAPLVGEWRAMIAAGGAQKDLALARMATGTATVMVAMDLAMNDKITGAGPTDPAQRELFMRTKKPFSVKWTDAEGKDRYFAYDRMSPLGDALAVSSVMVEVLSNMDQLDGGLDDDMFRAYAATLAAVGSAVTNKTFMRGFAALTEALSDPTRYSADYLKALVSSTVPAIAGEVARARDPYMRVAADGWDALARKTPYLSEDVPIRHDGWGTPLTYRSGLGAWYDGLSPIYSSAPDVQPIDAVAAETGYYHRAPARSQALAARPGGPSVAVNLNNVSPAIYQRFVVLAGNELKLPEYGNMGAKDFLNAVVTGKSDRAVEYDLAGTMPGMGSKEDFIRGVVADYRAAARERIVEEFPQLEAIARRKLEKENPGAAALERMIGQ